MSSARIFFTPEQQEEIRIAIMNAELDTSGEIRVHIENTCKGDAVEHATHIFEKLKMNETQSHNGVLIYLAVKNRKFAIIGDSAIHAVVSDSFWESTKNRMLEKFRGGLFTEGLVNAITEAGNKLKAYFPYQTTDINELPDDISFS